MRWLVTVDAMHTQVVTAKLICATLKSHYLMIVKSNKPKYLPYHRAALGRGARSRYRRLRGHGRVKTRTLQIITAARGIGFPTQNKSSDHS
ncbi:putative transposase for IS2404 [Mycobacterium ulcerans str. Harvey]|uniref:Transposase for IS2404 n=1 Tax=Mycobacterium ulcerans str. Harvey TaxID=1299332 RepID=A0ABN0RB00_MYCUL|nr:putative transposase for IS2404 [Mycobacterium ulcerans str. Harvey]